jgi:phage-related minor tail protein
MLDILAKAPNQFVESIWKELLDTFSRKTLDSSAEIDAVEILFRENKGYDEDEKDYKGKEHEKREARIHTKKEKKKGDENEAKENKEQNSIDEKHVQILLSYVHHFVSRKLTHEDQIVCRDTHQRHAPTHPHHRF